MASCIISKHCSHHPRSSVLLIVSNLFAVLLDISKYVSIPPVTYEASSLSRKQSTFATSSAFPMRPNSVVALIALESKRPFFSPSLKIAVSIGPLLTVSLVRITKEACFVPATGKTYGRRALIRIPLLPNSPAADSVNPMTPNLLDAYAAL